MLLGAMARVTASERRQQLIDAAFRVMTRDGVAAASTRAIAAEANAPLASFHYVFSSKEELLREVTESLVEQMLGAAMEGLEPTSDAKVSLRQGLHNLWDVSEATAAEQQMLYELAQAGALGVADIVFFVLAASAAPEKTRRVA